MRVDRQENETPDDPLTQPHAYAACTAIHLLREMDTDPHCAVPGCGRGPNDEIHKVAAAA